jgi:hypothetical protein
MPMGVAKIALLLTTAAAATPGAAFAQGGADEPQQRAPALAPLGVGPLHIASNAALDVENISIDVTLDAVVATYVLKNKGKDALDLAASFALPGLRAFAEDGEPWNLPAATSENPVALSIAVDGASVALKADVKAYALGVDRRREIEAAHLPLLPFGPRTAQALADLDVKAQAELANLGVVSPRDPDHPDRPVIADWTLAVGYNWMQALPAGKITTIAIKYAPLKAKARYGPAYALELEELKDEACLTPAQLGAAEAKLKQVGGALDVAAIALVNEPPLEWFASPLASVSVRKPDPQSIVAFCGMDQATAGQPVVRGLDIGGEDARDVRILIIEPRSR